MKYLTQIVSYTLLTTLLIVVSNGDYSETITVLASLGSFICTTAVFGYGILNIKEKQIVSGIIVTLLSGALILLYLVGFIIGALSVA